MNPTQYGDMARWTTGVKNTSQIKGQLRELTQELASGKKADLTKHLGFDQLRVNEIDEKLRRLDAFSAVRANSKMLLNTQQTALGKLEASRTGLSKSVLAIGLQPTSLDVSIASDDGRSRFADMVRDLNTTVAGQSVFSGSETGVAALPDGQSILANLEASIDFTQPPDAIIADINAYFLSDTGPYATTHYGGGDDTGMQRQVAPGVTVGIGSNALDPGIRAVLAGTAAISVAQNVSDADDRLALLKQAAGNLVSTDGLIGLRGKIGLSQARIEQAQAQSEASSAALQLEHNDRVSADPFETATRLQKVQTQLETHFTMLGRMAKLSLVNYI